MIHATLLQTIPDYQPVIFSMAHPRVTIQGNTSEQTFGRVVEVRDPDESRWDTAITFVRTGLAGTSSFSLTSTKAQARYQLN